MFSSITASWILYGNREWEISTAGRELPLIQSWQGFADHSGTGTEPMDDSAPPQPQPEMPPETPAPPPVRRRPFLWAVVAVCLGIPLFWGSDYLAERFLSQDAYRVRVPLSVLTFSAALAAVVAGGAIVYFIRQWKRQVTRLRNALDLALEGQLLIEELEQPFGGLTPLAPPLLELLRERRQHRSEISRLHLEIDRRVAKRTDALERLIGKLRAQATRDVLTGLYNRRMLDQCLNELISRCTQDRQPLCLLMIDVDDFKLLNDTLGHAAGDTLLRAIGQLIRSSIRQQDLAFRCGGDEFLVVLPQSPKAHGEGLARRLNDLVDGLAKTLTVARRPRLSIGVSMLGELPTVNSGQELIKEADRRLYAAKSERKAAQRGGGPQDRAA
jgi:diguanylate cyclase (GGDEF)-like protein